MEQYSTWSFYVKNIFFCWTLFTVFTDSSHHFANVFKFSIESSNVTQLFQMPMKVFKTFFQTPYIRNQLISFLGLLQEFIFAKYSLDETIVVFRSQVSISFLVDSGDGGGGYLKLQWLYWTLWQQKSLEFAPSAVLRLIWMGFEERSWEKLRKCWNFQAKYRFFSY